MSGAWFVIDAAAAHGTWAGDGTISLVLMVQAALTEAQALIHALPIARRPARQIKISLELQQLMQVHPVAVMIMSDPSPRQSDCSQCKAGLLPSGAGYSATLRRTELEAAGRGHPCYGAVVTPAMALH